MLCPAKYSWSRVTGIEAAEPRAGMNYGKRLREALPPMTPVANEVEALAWLGELRAEALAF